MSNPFDTRILGLDDTLTLRCCYILKFNNCELGNSNASKDLRCLGKSSKGSVALVKMKGVLGRLGPPFTGHILGSMNS